MDHYPCDTCKFTGKVEPYFYNAPNLLTDLNAIHEIEEKLKTDEKLWAHYKTVLTLLCENQNTWVGHATAPQRLEALARTLFPERFKS